jgi:hypothetical protein
VLISGAMMIWSVCIEVINLHTGNVEMVKKDVGRRSFAFELWRGRERASGQSSSNVTGEIHRLIHHQTPIAKRVIICIPILSLLR